MDPELKLLTEELPSSKESRHVVLIADDSPHDLDSLYEALAADYRVRVARDGTKALELALEEPRPDIILLDVEMPGLSGHDVCVRLKNDPTISEVPVIFITRRDSREDEAAGLEMGAVDYITKPIFPEIVRARVQTQLTLKSTQRVLENLVAERTRELEATRMEVIDKLGLAAEYRDNETGSHIRRMSEMSALLALRFTENEAWSELVRQASPMHDIGKMGIPDQVLLKPGRLNEEEWEIMKQHTVIGAAVIGESEHPLFRTAREIALYHHEKWDGTGYPHGLKRESIPLAARIVAIADVFDALTSDRPYKKAWSIEETVEFIYDNQGSHFDPELCQVFLDSLDDILEIRQRFSE